MYCCSSKSSQLNGRRGWGWERRGKKGGWGSVSIAFSHSPCFTIQNGDMVGLIVLCEVVIVGVVVFIVDWVEVDLADMDWLAVVTSSTPCFMHNLWNILQKILNSMCDFLCGKLKDYLDLLLQHFKRLSSWTLLLRCLIHSKDINVTTLLPVIEPLSYLSKHLFHI